MTENPPEQDSRRRILAAAAEEVASRGYEGATIARIASSAGLPASSIYWHFKDKDDLIGGVLDFAFEEWMGREYSWAIDPAAGDSIQEMVGPPLREVLVGFLQDPTFIRVGHVLALQPSLEDSAARQAFVTMRAGLCHQLAESLCQAIAASGRRLDEEDGQRLSQLLLVVADGFFLAHRAGQAPDLEQYVDLQVRAVEWEIERVVRPA